jgi:hypothetical protein
VSDQPETANNVSTPDQPCLIWAKRRVAALPNPAAEGDFLIYLLADAYLVGAELERGAIETIRGMQNRE